MFTTCFNAFGQAAATFVAQNKGAGRYTRIRTGVKQLTKFIVVLACVCSSVIWFGGRYLLRMFLDVSEYEVITLAVEYMRVVSVCFIPLALMHLYSNILRAMSRPAIPLAGGVFEFIARTGCTLLAVLVFENRVLIWISAPVAWILTDPALIIRYKTLMKRFLKEEAEAVL